MRKIFISLLVAVLMMAAIGCGGSAAPDKQTSPETETVARTITDHVGNIVTLPEKVERVAVCDIYPLPSVLAVFFDSADKIVGMPDQSMKAAANSLLSELYPEILQAETGYINGTSVNVEELLKLHPDVVFYSSGSPELGQQLRDAGFSAVAISAGKWNYNAIDTLHNWILTLSEIFPENDRADVVKAYSDDKFVLVQERVSTIPDEERKRLFFLFQYSDNNLTTSGRKFFGQWWAEAIGAINVGEEMDTVNSTAVSMEQVYVWNPQHILITNFNTATPQDLYDNTIGNYDWSIVEAVQNRNVDKMPLGMYRSYTCGVDTPVTLMWMAKTVYPEQFADIDITEETKAYYKTVFDIDLTDEQANRIFTPLATASAF